MGGRADGCVVQGQDVSLHSFRKKFFCRMNAVLPQPHRFLKFKVLFAIDISSAACTTTATTLKRNVPGHFNSVVQMDLLSAIHVTGGIDVLVFNPPYVPTEKADSWAGNIKFAWAGEGMGMATSWKVLDSLTVQLSKHYSVADGKDVLSTDGVFYLVAIEPNNPQKILEIMHERGIQGDIILKRKAGREVLYVLRFSRYTHK